MISATYQVTGVARDPGPLEELRAELGGSFTAVAADAADPNVAGRLIDTCRPRILVLNAGATPLPRPTGAGAGWVRCRAASPAALAAWTRSALSQSALIAPVAPWGDLSHKDIVSCAINKMLTTLAGV